MPKIGNVKIKNRLVLAPMAEVNDIAFRILCKRGGAGLIYNEMVNAHAVVRGNKTSLDMLRFTKEEKPITMQICGTNKDYVAKTAKYIEKIGADIVDMNFGCPVRKMTQIGAGAALLNYPEKMKGLLKAMIKAVDIPVTAKIRLGFKDKKNVIKLAQTVEEAGADAVAVHGRTAEQMRSEKADWEKIRQVKENVSIPVIGNGDVWCLDDAKKIIKQTKCDFAMIGRAAINNPYVFSGKVLYIEDRIKLFSDYVSLAKKNNCFKLSTARDRAMQFTRGLKGSASLRNKISTAKTVEIIYKSLNTLKNNLL